VPINPLEGLSKGITSVDLSTGVIVPLEPNIQIIGVDVSPYVYTRFPDVNATVKIDVTVKVRFPMNTTWSFPVSINGKETNVVAPVPITVLDSEGEVKTFSTTTQLTGGREAMLNPFASPSSHIDYTIGMGGVERKVSVYAYPDYTYLFVGLGALVVISSAIFIFRVRRTPASFGVKET
jgi:hypothetical protein